MSRIFVTGDLHGHIDFAKLDNFAIFGRGAHLTKNDYVIICGDFGLIFNFSGITDQEKYFLKKLDTMPWTTLFVDGNHECFPRLAAYNVEKWHGGKVHKIMPSIIHLMRGEVYDLDGRKVFAFGGAQSVDRYLRTPGQNWWPEEEATEKDFNNAMANLENINFNPDIIITHELPRDYKMKMFGEGFRINDKTSQILNSILYYCSDYKRWYCGHYHINKNITKNCHILYDKIEEVK